MSLRKADGTPVEVRDLAMNFADLKMATETRPPPFSGSAGEDVELWLRKFDRVAEALEWDAERKLKQVPLFLEQFTAAWWDAVTERGTKKFATWRLFEDGIKARFLPEDQAKRYKLEMRRRKQKPDEEVITYFNEKYNLCLRADPRMSDEDVIENLKNGLLHEFHLQLCLSKAKTPQEFFQELIDVQYALRRKGGREQLKTGPVRDKDVPKTGGGGGFRGRKNSRFRPRASSGGAAAPLGSGSSEKNSKEGGKDKPSFFGKQTSGKGCYNCGKEGHIIRDCPKNKGGDNGKGDKKPSRSGEFKMMEALTVDGVSVRHVTTDLQDCSHDVLFGLTREECLEFQDEPTCSSASTTATSDVMPFGPWIGTGRQQGATEEPDPFCLMHGVHNGGVEEYDFNEGIVGEQMGVPVDTTVTHAVLSPPGITDIHVPARVTFCERVVDSLHPEGMIIEPRFLYVNKKRYSELEDDSTFKFIFCEGTGKINVKFLSTVNNDLFPHHHDGWRVSYERSFMYRKLGDMDGPYDAVLHPSHLVTLGVRPSAGNHRLLRVVERGMQTGGHMDAWGYILAARPKELDMDEAEQEYDLLLESQADASLQMDSQSARCLQADPETRLETVGVSRDDDAPRSSKGALPAKKKIDFKPIENVSRDGLSRAQRRRLRRIILRSRLNAHARCANVASQVVVVDPDLLEASKHLDAQERMDFSILEADKTFGAAAERPADPLLDVSVQCPCVPVRLGGRNINALVDSGASMSVVGLSFLKGLGAEVKDFDFIATIANGSAMKALGKVDLTLEVVGKSRKLPFIVYEEFGSRSYEAVIGYNALKAYDMTIDPATDQLFPIVRPVSEPAVVQTAAEFESRPDLAVFCAIISRGIKKPIWKLVSEDPEALMDTSMWDYQWSAVPPSEMDLCDDQTMAHYDKLAATVVRFKSVFHTKGMPMGQAKVEPFRIELKEGAKPIHRRQYRYTPHEKEFILTETNEMLCLGVIGNSRSPWAFAITLAKKKKPDGTTGLRLCNDFRPLNDITISDHYPLPNVDDCLNVLAGSKYFSTLDCQSGYWQMPLDPESQEYTAFQAGDGFHEYKCLPFGLKNAPSHFQRQMGIVLAGLLWNEVFVYLDDIVIGGKTPERHLELLVKVLKRLEEFNLKLKPGKCRLMKSKVKVLGFVVSQDGVEPDPEKVRAVTHFSTPENLKAVRSFLGLCSYYRRFIKGFSELAAPLNRLAKKDVPFQWQDEEEAAFAALKRAMTTAPIFNDIGTSRISSNESTAPRLGSSLIFQRYKAMGTCVKDRE